MRLQRVRHDGATEHILASYLLEGSVFWQHPVSDGDWCHWIASFLVMSHCEFTHFLNSY